MTGSKGPCPHFFIRLRRLQHPQQSETSTDDRLLRHDRTTGLILVVGAAGRAGKSSTLVLIEAKAYGPDMTAEEREALLARVFVLEEGIIVYRAIPVQTTESTHLMLAKTVELVAEWPSFIEVLDLSEVNRPTAEVRAIIRDWMTELIPRMTHLSVVVGDNVVMRAVVRFLSYSMRVPKVSFHDTKEEAVRVARQFRD